VLAWVKEPIEGRQIVRLKIIQDNPDSVSIRVVVCNRYQPVDPFGRSPLFGCVKMSPVNQQFSCYMQISLPVAFIVVVRANDRSRAGQNRVARFPVPCWTR